MGVTFSFSSRGGKYSFFHRSNTTWHCLGATGGKNHSVNLRNSTGYVRNKNAKNIWKAAKPRGKNLQPQICAPSQPFDVNTMLMRPNLCNPWHLTILSGTHSCAQHADLRWLFRPVPYSSVAQAHRTNLTADLTLKGACNVSLFLLPHLQILLHTFIPII